MIKYIDAKTLNKRLEEVNEHLDKVETPHIAEIRNIINNTYFADIETEEQRLNNLGNVFYRDSLKDYRGNKWQDLPLVYIIVPKQLGVFYGTIYETTDKKGNPQKRYKSYPLSNYSRFIADVLSHKVIFAKDLEHFVFKETHSYKVIEDNNDFYNYYMINNKKDRINDFLSVFEELFMYHIDQQHGYTLEPYKLAGKDWIVDVKNNEVLQESPKDKTLYFEYYALPYSDIHPETAREYIEMVGGTPNSQHNTMLMHAYVMYRKMNLINPEKFFIFKDFGRTGKGLFFKTFQGAFTVHQINFNSLLAGSFETLNETRNLDGADLAHANETGEITKNHMKHIRKIASGEVVTARDIGNNNYTFKVKSVFALDTNEYTDIGELKANTARAVLIGFKNRPPKETEKQSREIFAPYWHFVEDNKGDTNLSASLSFLINSIEYLKANGGVFDFKKVTHYHYYTADQLTDTQKIVLTTIHEYGYILSGDENLKNAIEKDYISMRYKQAKTDFKKIGVAINQSKYIDGETKKVHWIGNKELFNQAYQLIVDELEEQKNKFF